MRLDTLDIFAAILSFLFVLFVQVAVRKRVKHRGKHSCLTTMLKKGYIERYGLNENSVLPHSTRMNRTMSHRRVTKSKTDWFV